MTQNMTDSLHLTDADIYSGETCGPCYRRGKTDVPAAHKVEEAGVVTLRHPFTQYVCERCFISLMGPAAQNAHDRKKAAV